MAEEDPWALFGDEEDVDVSGVCAATGAVSDACAPPSLPTPEEEAHKLRKKLAESVLIPLENTLPVAAKFYRLHCKATLDDLAKPGVPLEAEVTAVMATLRQHLADASVAVKQLEVALLQKKSGSKGGRGGAGSGAVTSAAASVDPAIAGPREKLRAACEALVDITWKWLKDKSAWPHITWRECFVMGQIGRAVLLTDARAPGAAMEALDLCLIMGAPAQELYDVVRYVEAAALTARDLETGRDAAVRQAVAAEVGSRSVSTPRALPVIPRVLGPSSVFRVPHITHETAILRVAGQAPAVKGGGSGGGSSSGMTAAQKKRQRKKAAAKRKAAAAGGGGEGGSGGGNGAADDSEDDDEDEAAEGEDSTESTVEHPTLAAIRAVHEGGGAGGNNGVLSLANFKKRFLEPGLPVVLVGCTKHWPAMDKWRDLDYWSASFGHRTIPVEIGQHLSGYWKEELMTFADFVSRYMQPSLAWGWGKDVRVENIPVSLAVEVEPAPVTTPAPAAAPGGEAAVAPPAAAAEASTSAPAGPRVLGGGVLGGASESATSSSTASKGASGRVARGVVTVRPDKIAYLAQHGLIEHLPRLTQDFDIPVYAGNEVGAVNAWFGTAGTVTRLHFDSYDNLLTQVVGYKYVRLYAPSQTPKLYAVVPKTKGGPKPAGPAQPAAQDATLSQGNISAYDVDNPDYSAHPLAKDAVFTETVLGPGDVLFIPKGTWHFVRSISPSFSLNFWF